MCRGWRRWRQDRCGQKGCVSGRTVAEVNRWFVAMQVEMEQLYSLRVAVLQADFESVVHVDVA